MSYRNLKINTRLAYYVHYNKTIINQKPIKSRQYTLKIKNTPLLLLTLISSLFHSGVCHSSDIHEFTVKAAFMVKMTHFIEWPSTANKESNFTICINHSHELKDSFSQWAQSGLIKNKPVSLKYIDDNFSQLSSCNMLYITNNKKLSFLLKQAKENNILTISDTPGNAKRGVLVNFFNENKKLRFEINLQAARDSGFVFNPRILKLATIVNSEGTE